MVTNHLGDRKTCLKSESAQLCFSQKNKNTTVGDLKKIMTFKELGNKFSFDLGA